MFDDDDFAEDPSVGQPLPGGTLSAMKARMADYVGSIQLQDILGLQGEEDWADLQDGPPMPLSQLSGAPMAAELLADPMDNETARAEMQDLLSERAKQRQSASESFQKQASQMFKGGDY